MLMRGRSFEVQAASASATLQMISQGAQLQVRGWLLLWQCAAEA
jgi:hypothetical protein